MQTADRVKGAYLLQLPYRLQFASFSPLDKRKTLSKVELKMFDTNLSWLR